jgi:hypothetical protein
MNVAPFKTLLICTVLGATTTALADSKVNPWDGFYAQLGVGYASFMSSSQSGTTTITSPPLRGTFPNSSSSSNINSPTANVSLGYNLGINEAFTLGVGATFFPGASSSASLSFKTTTPILTSTTNGTYNIKNVYNVFLSPGYVIDEDRLAYAKIGYAAGTVSAYAPTGSNSFPSTEVGINGVSMGLGYKQMVTKSIYLLGEFNYAIFNPASASVRTNSGAIVSTNIKGTGLDIIVGAGYRF